MVIAVDPVMSKNRCSICPIPVGEIAAEIRLIMESSSHPPYSPNSNSFVLGERESEIGAQG